MKKIFIINGSGGVGKDTFVGLVKGTCDFPVMNVSSVDVVKKAAELFGWSGEKSEASRKFLSDLKLLCTAYNDAPFRYLKKKACEFKDGDAEILFFHIREPAEVERAKKEFGAKTLLIRRPSVKQITSNMADGGVYDYTYDITIQNEGDLTALCEKAKEFVSDCIADTLKTVY